MKTPADIIYHPHGRFRSNHVGAHGSSEVGGFGVFRDQAPFLRFPDARRIDLRATLRDPFGETYVRRFEQRNAIDVYAIVDLSASMGFIGAVDRFEVACDICSAIAFSSTRIGDRFGLIAGGGETDDPLFLRATRSKRVALEAIERLREKAPSGFAAENLVKSAHGLGAGRKLVLLISDFRWSRHIIENVLDALTLHDVLPVVLVDSVEMDPPRWGLLELQDPETGRRRMMVMRPAMREKWLEDEAARRATLNRLAAGRARPPIFIEDRFDPRLLSLRLMAV